MPIRRPFAVVEDGLQRVEIVAIRVQPCIYVFRLDRNDATIVAGGGDFGRWAVGDQSERVEAGFVLA